MTTAADLDGERIGMILMIIERWRDIPLVLVVLNDTSCSLSLTPHGLMNRSTREGVLLVFLKEQWWSYCKIYSPEAVFLYRLKPPSHAFQTPIDVISEKHGSHFSRSLSPGPVSSVQWCAVFQSFHHTYRLYETGVHLSEFWTRCTNCLFNKYQTSHYNSLLARGDCVRNCCFVVA